VEYAQGILFHIASTHDVQILFSFKYIQGWCTHFHKVKDISQKIIPSFKVLVQVNTETNETERHSISLIPFNLLSPQSYLSKISE